MVELLHKCKTRTNVGKPILTIKKFDTLRICEMRKEGEDADFIGPITAIMFDKLTNPKRRWSI